MNKNPDNSHAGSQFVPFSDHAFDNLGEWNDELNRLDFCKQVASMLLDCKASDRFSISIEGEWGSGKSSVLSMIKSCLEAEKQIRATKSSAKLTLLQRLKKLLQKRKGSLPHTCHTSDPILVEYNPWLVGAADHMIQSLMAQIASELGQVSYNTKATEATEAAQKLIVYAQLLEPLKWVPSAEPWASMVKGIMENTGRGVKEVSELYKLNINRQREVLKKKLRELNRSIIIFIDDIDRLPPAEVFQIVRAIQAVSELPRCSFVLALDSHYAERSLQIAANFEAPGQYLDKLIQLRLPLPQINKADLASYFESRLFAKLSPLQRERFEVERERLSVIWESAVKPLIQTPRDSIRILNRFLFIEPKCGKEVCWGDLLGLQALAILSPTIYKTILLNPGHFTNCDPEDPFPLGSQENYAKQQAEELDKVLAQLSVRRRRLVERLLGLLFPLHKPANRDRRRVMGFSDSRRIASIGRLRIALAYDLPSDEVSREDVELFCYSSIQRQAIMQKILSRDLLDRFLDAVQSLVDPALVGDPDQLIIFLGELVEQQQINNTFAGMTTLLSSTTFDKVCRLSEMLLVNDNEPADFLSGLSQFVSNPSLLSLASRLLICGLKHEEEAHQSETNSSTDLISVSRHPVLRQWLDTAVSTFRSYDFSRIADKSTVVRTLLRLTEGQVQLPKLLQPYIASDQGMDSIAEVFCFVKGTTEGNVVYCDKVYVSKLGTWEVIKARAESRLQDPLVQRNTTLCAFYKSIVCQQKFLVHNAEMAKW